MASPGGIQIGGGLVEPLLGICWDWHERDSNDAEPQEEVWRAPVTEPVPPATISCWLGYPECLCPFSPSDSCGE